MRTSTMFMLMSVCAFILSSVSVPIQTNSTRHTNITGSSTEELYAVPVAPPIDHRGRANCRSHTICFQDEADNIAYPEQIIADAVSLLRLRQDLSEVSSELGDSPPPEYHRNETSTDNNDSKLIGDKHDSSNHTNYNGLSNPNIREWPACKAVNFHFPIKAALAEDGQWKYIVNNENYIQVVTGSICVSEGHDCDMFRFSLTVKSTCRQSYLRYSLVALDPTKRKPVEERFLIPSACVCSLKWTINE